MNRMIKILYLFWAISATNAQKSRLGNGINTGPGSRLSMNSHSKPPSIYHSSNPPIKKAGPKKSSQANSWIQNLFKNPTSLGINPINDLTNTHSGNTKRGKSGRKRGRFGKTKNNWKKQKSLTGATNLIDKIRNLMPNQNNLRGKSAFRSAQGQGQNQISEPEVDLGLEKSDFFDDENQEETLSDSDLNIDELVADFDRDTEFREWATMPIEDLEVQEISGFQARSRAQQSPKNLAKPRKRSRLTESLNTHFKPILFNQDLHEVDIDKKATCHQRQLYSQPVCCIGEDSFCQAPATKCSCDDSCMYFGDCCGDYRATCRFVSFHIDHVKDDKAANYFSRGPGQTEILVSRFGADYKGARSFCRKQNAKLISLHNRDFWSVAMRKLNHFILQKTPDEKVDFWIGLDDTVNEGSFTWTDGTTEYEGFTHWAANNPERGGTGRKQQKRANSQDCVHLSGFRDNKWVDAGCTTQKRFICERDAENVKLERGVAKITGDPHLITFDNFLIHFENTCSFTLTELCRDGPSNSGGDMMDGGNSLPKLDLAPFFIVGDIDNVSNLDSENSHFTQSSVNYYETYDYGQNPPTNRVIKRKFRLKDIHFHFGEPTGEVTKTISLMYDKIPMVNGKRVTLPYADEQGDSIVIDGFYLVLQTSMGITIYSDGKGHAEIEVPHTYFNNLCGLLGNYDNNANNDIADSKGIHSSSMADFAKAWRTNENPSCQIRQMVYDKNDRPCPAANLPLVNKYCRNLLIRDQVNNPFSECLATINSNHFFEMCAIEICNNHTPQDIENDIEGRLTGHCDFYEAMLLDCRRYGIKPFDWRINGFCSAKIQNCPENSHFSSCGDACPRTCYSSKEDIMISESCKDRCVEGCFCDLGYVFEDSGKCIEDTKKCGCIDLETSSFISHDAVTMSEDCGKKCTCDDGEIICKEHACSDGMICQRAIPDTIHEFSTCIPYIEEALEVDETCLDESYVIPTLKPSTKFKGFHGTRHPGGKIEKGLTDEIDGIIDQIKNNDAMRQIVEMTDPLWIKPNACCGPRGQGQPYNSETHGCCIGRVFNKEHYTCCENLRMHIKIENECPSKLLPNVNEIPDDLIPQGQYNGNNGIGQADSEHKNNGNKFGDLYEADSYQNGNYDASSLYSGSFEDSVDNSFMDPDYFRRK